MVTGDLEALRKKEQPKGATVGDSKLQGPEVRRDRGWPELGGEGVGGEVRGAEGQVMHCPEARQGLWL